MQFISPDYQGITIGCFYSFNLTLTALMKSIQWEFILSSVSFDFFSSQIYVSSIFCERQSWSTQLVNLLKGYVLVTLPGFTCSASCRLMQLKLKQMLSAHEMYMKIVKQSVVILVALQSPAFLFGHLEGPNGFKEAHLAFRIYFLSFLVLQRYSWWPGEIKSLSVDLYPFRFSFAFCFHFY